MKLSEYQEKAARTLIYGPRRQYSDFEQMLIWNATGLAGKLGEVIEASFTNNSILLKVELGDYFWWLSALFTKIGEPLPENCFAIFDGIPQSTALVIRTGKVVDLIKKQVFHDHGFDKEALLPLLLDCYIAFRQFCEFREIGFDSIMKTNIRKLQKRFPKGFTSEGV